MSISRSIASDAFPNHPQSLQSIPAGSVIKVLRLPQGALPYIEGSAVVCGRSKQQHTYFVRFQGESLVRERVVHPDYQVDLDRVLAWLIDLARAEQKLCASFSDFFPQNAPDR